jgi:hypothetical protein
MVICYNVIKQRPIFHHAYVIHSATFYSCALLSRMVFKLLADSLFVAICHSDWLHGRKYGTVRYHPASSMFLSNLFHPLSVSGKIDWHASGFKHPGLV